MQLREPDRDVSFVHRLRQRRFVPVWLLALAFASGVAAVVIACTAHNRCSSSDPACIFHSYTLVHMVGPGVLGFVGAPALISLMVAALLYVKVARRSMRAGQAALGLALLSCVIGFVGLVVDGLVMLLAPALTVGAVAATPLPPDPNDPLVQSGGTLSRLTSDL